ncbi:HNH endonuclease signature motif containing protein [Glaciibacter superstes]|uniref:HNH endonuclease signature motif containing protein n=1 Tax=Glaciibacter superstes TaxID=501023 RepID=UPI0003B4A18F|nr:HNH endonuclease signature motif containing protein [Glaciibacter superstes]
MPHTPTAQLLTDTETFAAVWEGACVFPTATGGADVDAQVAGMSDAGVVRAIEAGFAVIRDEYAFLARLAASVDHSSRSSLGADSLAKRSGSRNATQLLADRGRITMAEAARLIRVGTATTAPVSLLGERLPVPYPAVAAALDAGVLPVDSAAVIVSNLDEAKLNADPEDLAIAEEFLVDFAAEHAPDLVRKLAIHTRDRLDTDGVAPREEELVTKRGLSRINRRDGMVRYVLDADPVTAGFMDAWVNGHVGADLRKPRFEASQGADGCDDQHQELDTRTFAQKAADAVTDLLRFGLSSPESMGPAATTTMVIRMDLDALMTGLGEAQIDGVEQPISAGTARRMAAEAELIPAVLGGDSQVLDLGVSRRLFSRGQKLALAERDGGCAHPDCDRAPVYTEGHHLEWWNAHGGPTDLANGILLCSPHHHMIHNQGWSITVIDNVPWFIPPPSIDIHQKPRRGGKIRPPKSAA